MYMVMGGLWVLKDVLAKIFGKLKLSPPLSIPSIIISKGFFLFVYSIVSSISLL